MALAGELPPDASTASTGLGLRYVGTEPMFAYAYSGEITMSSSGSADTQMLLFETGSGLFAAKFQLGSSDATTSNAFVTVKFNDIIILNNIWAGSSASYQVVDMPYYLIIPPFTKVEVEVGSGGSGVKMTGLITGRVYDA